MRHLILLAVVLSSLCLAHAKCCAGGIWSAWAPSGKCSDSCGSCGKISYTRTCLSAKNGCPCSGPTKKTTNCNLMPCKYPRESCCGGMKALVTRGEVMCGPQPVGLVEAPGPAPGTPCSAPPPPPPPARVTKISDKATTKSAVTQGPSGPGGLPASDPAKSPCPDGWSYCPGASRCYKWTDGASTQPEAKSQCRELGGNLATIDSAAATQCLL
ncbi:Protein F58F9.10, partial [Aphelenchoides avenae]